MTNQVRVLGPVEITGPDRAPVDTGGKRQRRLLAALTVHAGDVVSVDSLVDIVFEGNPSDAAAKTLQSYVSRLRRAVDGDSRSNGSAIERVEPGYVIRLDASELDVTLVEEQIAAARHLARNGDHAGAVRAFDEALRAWRGRPYAEFADEPWALAEAQRLIELRATAIEERAESQLALGGHAEVITDLERFATEEPTRERPRAQLMVALYRSGRQADALRIYQDYFGFLRDEMGLEPSKALRELEGRILSEDPSLDLGGVGGESLRGYRLFEELGRGAFSVVHRGTQPSVGRDVAVKTIRAELANDADFVRRFETEAHMVANLEHPHIVPLYDFWREPDGAYLVMRWLRGGTLSDRIADGPLPPSTAVALVRQVGGALEAAHRQGIVHRDIKPANVFCDDDGNFYLGDFGIAVGETADDQVVHATTAPAYASPELLEHRPAGPTADIYSLGVTVFEALTGAAPFADAASDEELIRRQIHEPLPPVSSLRPGVSSRIDEVIGRATAKSVMGRYGSAREFVAAFVAAVEPESTRAVTPTAPAAEPGPNPYKGLRAFHEADAGDFFGRTALVGELLGVLGHDGPAGRLLTVVGPSGSGKSSVVRAGLVPAVREGALPGSDGWFVSAVMPGSSPFAELEAALLRIAVNPPPSLLDQLTDGPGGIGRAVKRVLPDDHAELLLVVDQFEELFTLTTDPDESAAFLGALLAAVDDPHSRIRVVATLRADFYDRPLRDPRIAGRIKQSTVVVTPLAPDELAEAIALPARRAGAVFEDGLVARITADVADQPGSLPLLQYTLAELYDRGRGHLTHDLYEQLGGVAGALAGRAEAIHGELAPATQDGARLLFSRLVTLGEDTEDTRRRILQSELGTNPAVKEAIDAFGSSRLLTFDRDADSREPTVEVAHEALLREWPRLRQWIDDDRDGLRIHRHLTTAATAWAAKGKDAAELYRGSRLDGALTWADTHADELNDLERRFLDTSRHRRDLEIERTRRQTRRLRRSLTAVAAIALVAMIAGLLAYREQRRAEDARGEAEGAQASLAEQLDETKEAQADADAATAQLEVQNESLRSAARRSILGTLGNTAEALDDPALALLIALEANAIEPGSPVALDALAAGLLKEPGWLGAVPGGWMRAAPALNAIVVREPFAVVVRDADDPSTVIRSIPVPGDDLTLPLSPAVSPDGSRLAIGSTDGIQIVDLTTGRSGDPVPRSERQAEFPAVVWTSDAQLLTNEVPGGVYAVEGLELELVERLVLPGLDPDRTPGAIFVADPSRGRMAVHYKSGELEIWDTTRIGEPDVVVGSHSFSDGVLIPSWGRGGELMVANITRGLGATTNDARFWRTGPDPLSTPIPVETGEIDVWRATELSDGSVWVGGAGRGAVVDGRGALLDGPWLTGPGTPQDFIELSEDRFVVGSLSTGSLDPGPISIWSRTGATPLSETIPGLVVPPGMIVQYFADEQIATLSPEADPWHVLYHAIHVTAVWDLRGPAPQRVSYPGEEEFDRMRLSITDDGPVVVAVTDPDQPGNGRSSPHGTEKGTAAIYDALSAELIGDVEISGPASISGFYVSADRTRLTVHGNAPLRFFDIDSGELITSIEIDGNAMWVARDEQLRRGYAVSQELVVYDLDSLDVLDRVPLGTGDLIGDDRRLIPDDTGSLAVVGGNPLKLVELPGGTPSGVLDNPEGLAGRLDATNRLVVGWGSSPSDGVQLWDLESRRSLGPFVPGPVGDQHIGGELVQARDGHAHVWNLDVESWPEIACRAAGRSLTREEWDIYVGSAFETHLGEVPAYDPVDCSSA